MVLANIRGIFIRGVPKMEPLKSGEAPAFPLRHVFARGALDHLHGELEEADFPGIVHAGDEGAEGVLAFADAFADEFERGFDRFAEDFLGEVRFPELETVAEDAGGIGVRLEPIGELARLVAEAL